MTDETEAIGLPDDEAEVDEIVGELERAGLVEVYDRPGGKVGYRLTHRGEQVRRALAMAGDDDAAAVFDALLDEADRPERTT